MFANFSFVQCLRQNPSNICEDKLLEFTPDLFFAPPEWLLWNQIRVVVKAFRKGDFSNTSVSFDVTSAFNIYNRRAPTAQS